MNLNPNAKRARRGAAIAIAIVGVIHLALAKEQLDSAAYVGVLFIAGGVASLYVATRLWLARDIVAWSLGAIVAVGMFVGFILSRTTGLPGFKEAEWEPSGILSLVLEAAYLGALAFWLQRRSRRWHEESTPEFVGVALERVAPDPTPLSPPAERRDRPAEPSTAGMRGG